MLVTKKLVLSGQSYFNQTVYSSINKSELKQRIQYNKLPPHSKI